MRALAIPGPRWAVQLAALTAALLVAACGGTAGVSTSSTPKNAQGVTSNTIKIGATEPLSGGAAASGAGFKAGLDAAVQEINAKGGVNGRKFSLTVLDDGFEAARSVANVRRLGDEEQVYAIVVPAGSANLPGSWPYVQTKGIPVFGPVLPPDPKLKSVFLLGTSHTDQARVITDFLNGKGVKTVGYVGQDNDLGTAILSGLTTQTAKYGMKIVDTEKTQANSTNVSAAVLKLRDAKPDAVVLGTDNTQTGLILKQSKSLGFAPIFIGDSSTANTGAGSAVNVAGDAADGLYGSMVIALTTESSSQIEAYRAAMQKYDPDQVNNAFALQAYAYSQVFFQLVKKQGSDLSWSNFEKVAEGTKNLQTGLLPPVSFGPLPDGHTGTQGAKIAQYKGAAPGGTWSVVTSNWITYKK
jgi:branched-chain amino acid transport system substrate-binding protein